MSREEAAMPGKLASPLINVLEYARARGTSCIRRWDNGGTGYFLGATRPTGM